MMPAAPPEVLQRVRAPREPPRIANPCLPRGANAFDVMRLNAKAPAMSRRSPDSFLRAIHEWRGLGLEAFRNVRKDGWTQPEHTAYRKRLYVFDLVKRAVSALPAHESSLMTSVEREDWAAVRFDYLRCHEGEEMCKYITHTRLIDPTIIRRASKKRRRDDAGDDEV